MTAGPNYAPGLNWGDGLSSLHVKPGRSPTQEGGREGSDPWPMACPARGLEGELS